MDSDEKDIEQLLKARSEIEKELRRHKSALTIVFTDIVGSTAYFDRYGDTAGIGMLDRHATVVTEHFVAGHGRVIKTIGDSVMAEFPDPASAVRAGIATQLALLEHNKDFPPHERIQVRIGIHTGQGYRRDNDVFGDAVNVAARITKHTKAAQILVSSAVREAVASEADVRCTSQGKIAMSGKSEKEEVFEVVWTDPDVYAELRRSLEVSKPVTPQVSPGHLEQFLAKTEENKLTPTSISGPLPALPATLSQRYEILGQIGKGGMGVVYKARDRETGEMLALKVINPEVADDPVQMERFKRESRLARKITHKNVCRIHDFGRVEGIAYFSMEFVSGENLRTILNRFGGLPVRKALDITHQIIAGLREAHAQGVIHRDLKPENIMLDEAGLVKIMDFGLARTDEAGLTRAGTIVGTPGYVSPEMIEGRPVDVRSDIYALGCVLYEMVTGTPAFTGDTPIAMAMNQLHQAPCPPRELEPGLPVAIEEAILICLEKDADQRFATVDELEGALSQAQEHSGEAPAIPAPPPARAQVPAWMIGAALGLGVVLIGGGGFWWMTHRQPPAQNASAMAPTPAEDQPAANASKGAAATPDLTKAEPVKTEPAKTEPPKTEAVKPEPVKTETAKTDLASAVAKAAKKAAKADKASQSKDRTFQVKCDFQIKQGSLTISNGDAVLLQENLAGTKKSGGFLGMRTSYVGVISKPLTIPAGVQELSLRVSVAGIATPLTGKVAIPGDPDAKVLHVDVNPPRVTGEFSKPPAVQGPPAPTGSTGSTGSTGPVTAPKK